MWENLRIARYRFTCQAKEEIKLPPYKGSALRGGFGYAFRQVSCPMKRGNCAGCLLRESCVYSYVFETPSSHQDSIWGRYSDPPRPFVVEPPLEEKPLYQKGEGFGFGLVLVGKAIDYLPYFIYTFDQLGERGIGRGRGSFLLESVEETAGKGGVTIYDGQEKILRKGPPPIDYSAIQKEAQSFKGLTHLGLRLLTPLRLRYGRKLVEELQFHILFRNLLRRLSALYELHCGGKLELHSKGLVERATKVEVAKSDLRWYDWERYSGRQKLRMKLGGLRGEVTFQGNLEEFIPYLLMGELLHAGKGATFGLGKYEILRGGEISV